MNKKLVEEELEIPRTRPLPYEEAQPLAEKAAAKIAARMMQSLHGEKVAIQISFSERDLNAIEASLCAQIESMTLGTLMNLRKA